MKKYANIYFLGASGVVTGSKIFIETSEQNILIDCGMFQGLKALRELNWIDFPICVETINVVLLTHGHLDHVGYLPRLIKQGFTGRIIGTAPTLAIAEIILRDSAKIHEEETEKANREKYTRHNPALPFYTIRDAEATLKLFQEEPPDKWVILSKHISYRFQYNGHIIGATFIELDIKGKRFVFSGDIGRSNDLLLNDPKTPQWADFLFIESTYGNKLYPEENVESILASIINETLYKKGNLIIPSFAVERLQTVMYILWQLYKKNKIPNIPVFIDSPMGTNILEIFKRFPKWHKLTSQDFNAMCNHFNIVKSYRETWETIDKKNPKIIVAGSGMVTGGRVLTYLQQLIDDTATTVLLVGYQAEGTRGRHLLDGVHEIKLFGKYYPVRAKIKSIESLSAHADQKDLIQWMSSIKNIPERVYLIHGEPSALDVFKVKIKDTYNWNVMIPKLYDSAKVLI